jgi:hypothetical protein
VLVRLFPATVAMAVCAAAMATAGGHDRVTPDTARLPDLDQEVPWDLQITAHGPSAAREYRLGFASGVRNIGAGPLIISGRRAGATDPTMTADQVIERGGAPPVVVKAIGTLRYVHSSDHDHWHLLGFERYELRRPRAGAQRVADRKTGFCLGDRYRSLDVPARAGPRFTGRCGLGATARLRLVEGISVGYGDDYRANLEGQSLRLTGLGAGRYVLIHRVNARRRLRETEFGNNASALLLRLRWRAGMPHVRVLRRCPDTADCN